MDNNIKGATLKKKKHLCNNDNMQIFIRALKPKTTLTEKIITLDVKTYDNIESIKTQVMIKEGIPIDYQRIGFNGKELEDKSTLVDYNIKKESTLDLVIRY